MRQSSKSISELIRSKIISGEYLPGQKLPTVRSLAKEMNVSSDTTFRAYKVLQASGLLHMNQGSFSTVANPLPGDPQKKIIRGLSATGPVNEYESLSVASNVRSLATNVPDLSFFQSDVFMAEMRDGVNQGPWSFYYAPPQGDLGLRTMIAHWLNGLGTKATPDNVIITLGSQHGLSLAGRCLLNRGDTLAIEAADHLGGMERWASQGIEREIIPSLLDDSPDREKIGSTTAKVLTICLTGCGLSGRIISAQDRMIIKEICQAKGITIIEDVSNSFISFQDRPLDMFDSSSPIIQVGSFSNILAPGVRIGFLLASQDQCHALARLIQNDTGGLPLPPQIALASYLRKGLLTEHITKVTLRYKKRRNALLSSLAIHMPRDVAWSMPMAGFGCRIRLAKPRNIEETYELAVERGVSFTPGRLLVHSEEADSTIRLCFGNQSETRISEGVRILGEILA